jgi:hypothetical protein
MGRQQKTPEQYKKFGELVASGKSPKEAMIEAGWSEAQARKGKANISQPMLDAIVAAKKESFKETVALGQSITVEEQEALVRGSLVNNVIEGKDAGVQSAKLLGAERRLNMWATTDALIQAVIIQAPDRPVAQIEKPDEPKMLEE